MAQGRITYWADWDYVDKQLKEFTLTQEVIEKLDSIEPGAERNYIQWIKVNWEIQTPDQYRVVDLSIPEVEDTLSSYDNTAALSARQWRVLYNYIKDLQQVWHFLSNWNCATWLPQTNPQTNPYVYNTWDYFIVSNVSSWTNYKPNWAQYIIWQASITVESDEVKVWDFYVYDWTDWLLLINTERQIAIDASLSTTSTNPVENRVITNALNLKANDADISTVWKTNDFNDLDNLPSIPDSLDDLSWDSDDIVEWSAHLFLTSSERTNLSHQSWVNTWDENQWSIKQKLWAASSSSDWYLTSIDWSTFNDKQDEISDLSDIRNNATAWKNASDTIATYWDVVTHDANEFATAAQWAKADTALQSWDNVSELTNDAGYITDAYHDSTKQDKLIAWANIQIAADSKTISATDTTYTAGTWIDITNWVISNTQTSAEWGNITWTLSNQTDIINYIDSHDTVVAATAPSNPTEWMVWYDTTNDSLKAYNWTSWETEWTKMVVLEYWVSTWQDFLNAYNKNALVYCKVSSWSSWYRMAFMAYTAWSSTPTEVEFQYYRSRSSHSTAANQLDEVYVYKLTSAWVWTTTQRDAAAKAISWTWIWLSFNSSGMTISNTWVTSINSQTWDVTLTVPTNVSDLNNDAWYITDNDLPTVDTSMSDSSTNAVQNKIIKSYVDTQVQEATSWAVSNTAYWSSWDWVTWIAPSKNAVYDKISAMDTTISWKQDTISDLATIRTWAWKWATAVQPNDNVSSLTNDAGYITKAVNDLTNYYTKSETYTKSEVADYVANFAWFKVVSTLPTTDIKTTIIYLLWPIWSWADKYEEWIYSNNAWVKIWETTVDLTNYFNKTTDDTDDITEWNNKFVTTSEKNTWNAKQNALATQTAYSAKWSATKVPQITTNNLWQVTWITEVTITQPTVNNSTITYTQAWDTITTTTTNQSSASTVALRWDIFVTQAQYNNLPSTKTTDWNTYIIYKT